MCAAVLVLGPRTAYARDLVVGTDAPSIQAAIDAAAAGDRVLVPPGVYYETLDLRGKAIAVVSTAGAARTIIDGSRGGFFDPVVQCASGETRATLLEGFTIRRHVQLGVRIAASSPTIRGCVIVPREAGLGGAGGIGVVGGGPLIEGNVVAGNGTYAVTNDYSGGGIVVSGDGVEIVGNAIVDNAAQGSGGGAGVVVMGTGRVVLRGNLIRGNRVTGDFNPRCGGGVTVRGSAILAGNEISGNAATTGGGVSWYPDGTGGTLALYGNTIVANDAPDGSALNVNGIAGAGAALRLVGNLLVGAPGQPAFTEQIQTSRFHTEVVQQNDVYSDGAAAYGTGAVDRTGLDGNLSADPLFVGAVRSDYRLTAASPLLDAGDPLATELPPEDLLGAPRVADGDGDSEAVADIGAYEVSGLARPAEIRLADPAVVVREGGLAPTIRLQRERGDLGAASVRLRVVSLDGTAGVDCATLDEVVDFAPGDTAAARTLPVADDGWLEPEENLAVVLEDESAGARLGRPAAGSVILRDGLPSTPGYFPLPLGASWDFRQADGRITRASVANRSTRIHGVATRVVRNSADGSRTYFTADADGLRIHRITLPRVNIPGYGVRSAHLTALDPVLLAPEHPDVDRPGNGIDPAPGVIVFSSGWVNVSVEGLGVLKTQYDAEFRVRRAAARTAEPFAGSFVPLWISGKVTLDLGGDASIAYDMLLGPGVGIVDATGAAEDRATLVGTTLCKHSLSLAAIDAGRPLVLSARRQRGTVLVTVKLANAAEHDEVVEDAAALDRLVSLRVESLGTAPAPAASRSVPRRFPFVLHAGRTATLRYRVPVDAANDPAESSHGTSDHDDFRVLVALDPASLDPRPRSPLLTPGPAGDGETSIDVIVR